MDDATTAIRVALTNDGLVGDFARRLRVLRGWNVTERAAHQHTLKLLGGYQNGRGLWLDDAVEAVRLLGYDPTRAAFEAAAKEGEAAALRRRVAELEAQLQRPGVQSVRRRRQGRGEAA